MKFNVHRWGGSGGDGYVGGAHISQLLWIHIHKAAVLRFVIGNRLWFWRFAPHIHFCYQRITARLQKRGLEQLVRVQEYRIIAWFQIIRLEVVWVADGVRGSDVKERSCR